MATIPTLGGPIDTSELGTVLMHEHIYNLTAEIQMVHPGFNGWDPDVQVPEAQKKLRVLADEGVDPKRVMLAHCGDTTDLDYLEELAASGALLGMDRFGLDVMLPFEDRVNTVVAMCERGHADQMVLSQDASCFTDWLAPGLREQVTPNWHFLHVVQDVIPALLERGVSHEQVEQMMRVNPRTFFERT